MTRPGSLKNYIKNCRHCCLSEHGKFTFCETKKKKVASGIQLYAVIASLWSTAWNLPECMLYFRSKILRDNFFSTDCFFFLLSAEGIQILVSMMDQLSCGIEGVYDANGPKVMLNSFWLFFLFFFF